MTLQETQRLQDAQALLAPTSRGPQAGGSLLGGPKSRSRRLAGRKSRSRAGLRPGDSPRTHAAGPATAAGGRRRRQGQDEGRPAGETRGRGPGSPTAPVPQARLPRAPLRRRRKHVLGLSDSAEPQSPSGDLTRRPRTSRAARFPRGREGEGKERKDEEPIGEEGGEMSSQ